MSLYKRSTNDIDSMFIRLNQHGITSSEISELIERLYGTYFLPKPFSKIAQVLSKRIEVFHKRPISPRFVCIYLVAAYLALERDTISKEASHEIVRNKEEGIKEVLD